MKCWAQFLNMKSEYYLLISLFGILLLAFGLFGMMRNSHKNVATKERTIEHTGDMIGAKDMTKYPPDIIGTGELKNVQNEENVIAAMHEYASIVNERNENIQTGNRT